MKRRRLAESGGWGEEFPELAQRYDRAMAGSDTALPPLDSLAGICCFVGSTTFKPSEEDVTRAYAPSSK
jgi:hypothetical protein